MAAGDAQQRRGELDSAIGTYEVAVDSAADGWEMASALNGLSDAYFALDRPLEGFRALQHSNNLIGFCTQYRSQTRSPYCPIPENMAVWTRQ